MARPAWGGDRLSTTSPQTDKVLRGGHCGAPDDCRCWPDRCVALGGCLHGDPAARVGHDGRRGGDTVGAGGTGGATPAGPIQVLVWNNALKWGHVSRVQAIAYLKMRESTDNITFDTTYAHTNPNVQEQGPTRPSTPPCSPTRASPNTTWCCS